MEESRRKRNAFRPGRVEWLEARVALSGAGGRHAGLSLFLRGELDGTATDRQSVPDVGAAVELIGSGKVAPLGQVHDTATIHAAGFIRNGRDQGQMVLFNEKGSVNLLLVRAAGHPFDTLTGSYRFTITGGSGLYGGVRGSGKAVLDLTGPLHVHDGLAGTTRPFTLLLDLAGPRVAVAM